MGGIIWRLTGGSGESLKRDLSNEMFLSLSGLKIKTRVSEILRSHPDFGDPGLFLSLKGPEPATEEGKTAYVLASDFLAGAFLLHRAQGLTDAIHASEAGETFIAGGRTMSLRSIDAELSGEPRRVIREEAVGKSEKPLAVLNGLLRRKLDVLAEGSEALGFPDYGRLSDGTGNLGMDVLTRQAEQFLTDTDCASSDLLAWFMRKRLELGPGQAKAHDAAHLLNSGELAGFFPKCDLFSFSATLLDASGLTPAGSIRCDGIGRTGKQSAGYSVPLDPPRTTGISVYPSGGVRDYESFLGSLGSALCFMFTDPGDEFEYRWLRESACCQAFTHLFGNLVYEPRWLGKYLKIDAGKDFFRLLNLRRLMSVRHAAGMTLYEAELYRNTERGSMPGRYGELMKSALHCGAPEADYLRVLTRPVSPADSFKGALMEPGIANFLRERFDEEWWRGPGAGEYLGDLWRGGGRVTAQRLASMTGAGPDSSHLAAGFERVLT